MRMTTTPPIASIVSSQLELCLPERSIDATSRTSVRTTSEASARLTSSPGSADGRPRSEGAAGPTTGRSGPRRSRARDSLEPESSSPSTTPGICGQSSKGSSRSAALQRSLANSLRTNLHGSSLCEVAWIRWDTPWQESLSKPRARVRSMHDLASTGSPPPTGAKRAGLWGTPRVTTNGGRGSPTAPDKSRIEDQVQATWNGSSTGTGPRDALNPEFVAWLLDYEDAWLDAAPPAKG
jgi:hypothetical protein